VSSDDKPLEVIAQTTVTLPYLDDLVPALYALDGRPYIPVCAVCNALGIRADTHIQRWRNLLLWETALKLPYQTRRGKRLVWCLLISEVPFLYSLFSWKHLSSERRAQLSRAARAGMKLAGEVYQQMQERYRSVRYTLFSLLNEYAGIDAWLDRQVERHLPSFERETQVAFTALIEQGRVIYHRIAAHARSMLQEQSALPIVDGVTLDAEQQVVDTFSMPLLPLPPEEDVDQLVELLYQLSSWSATMAAFWRAQEH
jgi:hypothetical protein